MTKPLADKIALVTGGTGSFGHAVIGPLLTRGVREIRVFSRDELLHPLRLAEALKTAK